MNWSSKRVLVTGAGGFIGSHLCEELVGLGADVSAMIRYTSQSHWGNLEFLPPEKKVVLRVVAGNIEDVGFVEDVVRGKDIVFHLAALIGIPYSYVAPRSYIRTNVEGTLNVLQSALKFKVEKVVHTSTSEVYGTSLYIPMDESHPLQAQSPYSASKIAADKIAESFHKSFGLSVTTLRPFNTYGPRQSARAIIPSIIHQALTQPEVCIGTVEPVRDLTFVKDTVMAFIRMAETDGVVGKVINVGTGESITIGDLAAHILRLIGCKKSIRQEEKRLRPPESEVLRLICNRELAEKLLGWRPQHSLEGGLMETIRFIDKNPTLYKTEQYVI